MNVGTIVQSISFGRERGGQSVVKPQSTPETTFYETSHKPQPRMVDCGPGIGKVLLQPDGSVVVDKNQLVKYTGYEVTNNLNPAEVESLPDGRFRLTIRK